MTSDERTDWIKPIKRRQTAGLIGSLIGIMILYLFYGLIIFVTVCLTGLALACIAGLMFGNREYAKKDSNEDV